MIDENGIDEEEQRLAFEEPVDPEHELKEWLKTPKKIVTRPTGSKLTIQEKYDKLKAANQALKSENEALKAALSDLEKPELVDEKVKIEDRKLAIKEWPSITVKLIKKLGKSQIGLPLITRLSKSGGGPEARFPIYRNYHEMAILMRENNTWLFQSTNQVHLAANCLGIPMLFEVFNPERAISWQNLQEKGPLKAIFKASEASNQRISLLASFLTACKNIGDEGTSGIKTPQEVSDSYKELIQAFPKKQQKFFTEKLNRFRSGDNLTDISEHITWGGKRTKQK